MFKVITTFVNHHGEEFKKVPRGFGSKEKLDELLNQGWIVRKTEVVPFPENSIVMLLQYVVESPSKQELTPSQTACIQATESLNKFPTAGSTYS